VPPLFLPNGAQGLQAIHRRHHDVEADHIIGRSQVERSSACVDSFGPVRTTVNFPIGIRTSCKTSRLVGSSSTTSDFHLLDPFLS
jgi:hypothetical protein